jgi:hypothetical protein
MTTMIPSLAEAQSLLHLLQLQSHLLQLLLP